MFQPKFPLEYSKIDGPYRGIKDIKQTEPLLGGSVCFIPTVNWAWRVSMVLISYRTGLQYHYLLFLTQYTSNSLSHIFL